MLDFFKKVFKRKKEAPPKPKKLVEVMGEVISKSLDPEKIIANFPKPQRERLTRELYDGLQALRKYGKRMKRAEQTVNLLKINNLFKIIAKYSHNIHANGVFIINEDERV